MARPAKFSDDELLERAMAVLWRRGWAHTSIRDLEDALEVKAPSIYRRFGTKDGLGAVVIDRYVDQIVQRRVSKYLTGEGDPIRNIERFLITSVAKADDDGRLRGCLLTTCSMEHDEPDAVLAEALARGFEVIESGLRHEVDRAASLGRLADGVDPADAVATLALVMQGLMSMSRGDSTPADLRKRARSAVALVARPDASSRIGGS